MSHVFVIEGNAHFPLGHRPGRKNTPSGTPALTVRAGGRSNREHSRPPLAPGLRPPAQGRGLSSLASEIQASGDGGENRNYLVSTTTAQGGPPRPLRGQVSQSRHQVAQAPSGVSGAAAPGTKHVGSLNSSLVHTTNTYGGPS